ncbi:MAG: DUF3575 domain-containing protein [Rikenellaceae bacterium]
MKKLLLLISILLLCPILSNAQNIELSSDSATLYYKPSNSTLYASYHSNNYSLQWLDSVVKRNKAKIISGEYHFNIFGFVMSHEKYNDKAINEASIQGSVLRAYLKTQYSIPHSAVTFSIDTTLNVRNQVMVQLSTQPIQSQQNSQISYSLKNTNYWIAKAVADYTRGVPYTSLYMQIARNDIDFANSNDFYKLNEGEWVPEDFSATEEVIAQAVQEEIENDYSTVPVAAQETVVQSTVTEKERQKVFGVKTNIPYWLVALPNLEVEFYMGKFVSIAAEGEYTYLNGLLANDQKYRATAGSAELRFWFKGDGKFTGFYGGLYGSAGFYDVALDMLGTEGNKCEYYSAGLSLGYVHQVGKSFFLEFGLAGGYIDFVNSKYTINSDGVKVPVSGKESIKGWGILPTKAKIALMWRF